MIAAGLAGSRGRERHTKLDVPRDSSSQTQEGRERSWRRTPNLAAASRLVGKL